MKIPNVIDKNKRRFPTNRIKHMNVTSAIHWVRPNNIMTLSDEIGLSYALKMPTMNGFIEWMPVVWTRKNSKKTIKKGFKFCFRFSSVSFSVIVGDWWGQCTTCFMHVEHAFDRSLCRFSSLYSFEITCSGTHPRSQQRDFFASFVRRFDKSHCGVSGI